VKGDERVPHQFEHADGGWGVSLIHEGLH
jgi:hypothetical protein